MIVQTSKLRKVELRRSRSKAKAGYRRDKSNHLVFLQHIGLLSYCGPARRDGHFRADHAGDYVGFELRPGCKVFRHVRRDRVPCWTTRLFEGHRRDLKIRRMIGIVAAAEEVRRLQADEVDECHFYTLNREAARHPNGWAGLKRDWFRLTYESHFNSLFDRVIHAF